MREPLLKITRIGTAGVQDEEKIKRITIVNKLCLTFATGILIVTPAFLYLLKWQLSAVAGVIIEFLINGSVLFWNYKRKYQLGSNTLFYLQCVSTIYFGLLIGPLLQVQFAISFLIAMAFMVFQGGPQRTTALFSTAAVLSVLEVSYYDRNPYTPVLSKLTYKEAYLLHFLVTFYLLTILIFISRAFVRGYDTNERINKANKLLKLYVAKITHDLRSPFVNIYEVAYKLLKKSSDDEVIRLASYVLTESNNGKHLVSDILEFEKIEAGVMDKRVGEVTFLIEPFFSQIIQTNELIARVRDIKLELLILNMPDSVVTDPVLLNQICTNLLTNAIRYSHSGETVSLSIQRSNDAWQMAVINKGPEIPPDKLPFIFDVFIGDKCRSDSNGLGLNIVKSKVSTLGGNISVESGLYTTFTVTLPLMEGRVKFRKPSTVNEKTFSDLSKIKLLIGEDNALAVTLIRTAYDELGINGFIARDGKELLSVAKKEIPDVVFVDYHMGDLQGDEIIREIRKERALKNIPIIATTGDSYSSAINDMLKAGATAFAEKENILEAEKLEKTLRQYLTVRNTTT